MSKKNHEKPAHTTQPEPTPDTNPSTTQPVDALPSSEDANGAVAVHPLALEVEQLQKLIGDTEARYELHLEQARARIVELEVAASLEKTLGTGTLRRVRDVSFALERDANDIVLAGIEALRERETPNPELREAAQRLRASTLPESEVVADAIRLLVEHHDPQDASEG